ncbi:MAG: cell division protein FtsA [Bacillota bacterium]
MERNLVLGVDAGSANVVATVAEIAGGEPQVIGVGLVPSAGVHRGVVVDVKAAGGVIRQAVEKACQMADCSGVNRAVVSVSGAHILSLVGSAEVPVHRPLTGVAPEDVRRALDAAAAVELPAGREVIHVAARSYRLDGNGPMRDPLGLAGRNLEAEAQLVTGEALPIQNHLRAVRETGLEVVDYQVAVRAAGEAVLTDREREEGVLLLEIGGGTTGVAVYERGHLFHVAVLPLGGEHITHDIAAVLRVPVATAEQLKRERGWADPALVPDSTFELVSPSGRKVREVSDKKLAEIIGSRVEEILQMAAVSVRRSGYGGIFPAGVVLTGGSSRLSGLMEVAADGLSLPARIGVARGPLVAEPELATAAGLVWWGAHLAREEAAATQETVTQDRFGRIRDWLKALFH